MEYDTNCIIHQFYKAAICPQPCSSGVFSFFKSTTKSWGIVTLNVLQVHRVRAPTPY